MKTKLYPYQREGIEQISRFGGRVLLADQMGLGKTAQGLVWMRENTKPPCIVICPASLKINWAREAWKFIRIKAEILEGKSMVIKGIPIEIKDKFEKYCSAHKKPMDKMILDFMARCCQYKPKRWKPYRQLIIISYDILQEWIDDLRHLHPKLVIMDECQYIKNRSALRTKAVRELCARVPFLIGMSGTPMTNRPIELFSILSLIRKDRYDNFYKFAWRYCNPKRNQYGWDFTGSKNLKELHKQLSNTCMIRRRKEDVLKDLPAKSRFVVPMAVQLKEYTYAEKHFAKWYEDQGKDKSKAIQIVKIGELKRIAAKLRLASSQEWIENFLESSDSKLLVFGIHKKIIEPLRKQFGKSCVVIDGSVRGQQRQNAIDKFQKSSGIRLLISNNFHNAQLDSAPCGTVRFPSHRMDNQLQPIPVGNGGAVLPFGIRCYDLQAGR